jgi:hypothetical protein
MKKMSNLILLLKKRPKSCSTLLPHVTEKCQKRSFQRFIQKLGATYSTLHKNLEKMRKTFLIYVKSVIRANMEVVS